MQLVVSGSMPALVTPLHDADALDLAAFAALVEQAVADGASGVLIAGSTGEGPLLEPEQRSNLVRTAVDVDAGLLVVACATGATLDDVHRDVDRAADAGAKLALVLAPSYLPLTPDELTDAHLRVAERSPIPNLVYHIPQFTGSALTPDAVAHLAGHEAIIGMKDSSPDADRRALFVGAGGAGFAVMTGRAQTLRRDLASGVAGSITAIANIRQRAVVALHTAMRENDAATAARLQESLSACESGLAAVPGSMPAVLKAALQLQGVIAERWCRAPLSSVSAASLDRVRTALLG